jgi:hypothetical protein
MIDRSVGLCYAKRLRDPSCMFEEQLLINVEFAMRLKTNSTCAERFRCTTNCQEPEGEAIVSSSVSFDWPCKALISVVYCSSSVDDDQRTFHVENNSLSLFRTNNCTSTSNKDMHTHAEETYRIYTENTRYII